MISTRRLGGCPLKTSYKVPFFSSSMRPVRVKVVLHWASASITSVLYPSLARAYPRLMVVVDLATPPLIWVSVYTRIGTLLCKGLSRKKTKRRYHISGIPVKRKKKEEETREENRSQEKKKKITGKIFFSYNSKRKELEKKKTIEK